MNLASQVAIFKGPRSLETARKSIKASHIQNRISKKPVLIKVNFITTKTWETGATTDPLIVEALVQEISKVNKEIAIVESDATLTQADHAAKATGILDLCDKYGIQFSNLSKIKDRITINIPDYESINQITIPRIVLESHIISAAKMKTHMDTTVTLGLKNMFGILPTKNKSQFHSKGISKVIVDINRVLRPTAVVVDGFVAMEGNGPVSGIAVQMDLVLSGLDPVSTDATASRIMGFNPHRIYHIKRCFEYGLGEIDSIQILGEKINSIKKKFKSA
ncbi:DUF362 domain-containing protein [[Eubacterium] cellulosolvens]